LAGTGVTVNAHLPGGATDTGMVPADIAPHLRQQLLHPDILIPLLLWLVSEAASGVTGSRFAANLWDAALPPDQAAEKSRVAATGSRKLPEGKWSPSPRIPISEGDLRPDCSPKGFRSITSDASSPNRKGRFR
jgi:hypothetical protein